MVIVLIRLQSKDVVNIKDGKKIENMQLVKQ